MTSDTRQRAETRGSSVSDFVRSMITLAVA